MTTLSLRKGNIIDYFTSFIHHHRFLPFSCSQKEKTNLPCFAFLIYFYLLPCPNYASACTFYGNS
jgi:hypothetical protein